MESLTLTQVELVQVFQLWSDEVAKEPETFSAEPAETYAQRSAEYFAELLEYIRSK